MEATEIPLRDIHLPPPPGYWPPAPGWWLLLALGLAIAALAWWHHRRGRGRRLHLRRVAAEELARLRAEHAAHRDGARLARDLSILMRRVALTLLPRTEAAGLHGDAWLALLDRLAARPAFCSGPGRVLAVAPYRPAIEVDAEALLAACEHVIAALPRAVGP